MKKRTVKKYSRIKKKTYTNKKNKGGIGSLYVVAILIIISVFGFLLIGQSLPSDTQANPKNNQVIIQTPVPSPGQSNLQLYTFNGATITPTSVPKPLSSCSSLDYAKENGILIGSNPPPNQTVTANGQIIVWVTDEGAPNVSVGESVNSTTGIITRGNTSILDKGSDGGGKFSWEPTVYIYPVNTQNFLCNALTPSCTPNYPYIIKGDYNPKPGSSTNKKGPPIDSYKAYENGPGGFQGNQGYTSEYIWEVNNFNLSPGTYDAQYIIHDGDTNIGVGCITVSI